MTRNSETQHDSRGWPAPAVIGTLSEATFDFLRKLGAEPVAYGDGLADRVRAMAPGGVSAAADLFGTEAALAVPALGVAPDRIATIAAGPNPPREDAHCAAQPHVPGAGDPDHQRASLAAGVVTRATPSSEVW